MDEMTAARTAAHVLGDEQRSQSGRRALRWINKPRIYDALPGKGELVSGVLLADARI